MKGIVLWDITSCNCVDISEGCRASILVSRRKSSKQLVSTSSVCLDFSSILKLEALRSPETSVIFWQATECHISDYGTPLECNRDTVSFVSSFK
jgi:hypothetical protein